jgi:hypothetical protein
VKTPNRFSTATAIVLCIFLLSSAAAQNVSAEMMTDALQITDIVSATVIHSPKGRYSRDGRVTSYVTDPVFLHSLHTLLSRTPAKGGKFKDFPAEVDHWRVYVHGKNSIVALDVYAYSLQSPIDASFPASAADPSGDQLKRLLETILEPLEEGQHPARGDAQ